ncbi:MAG: hypothetical protein GWN62_06425 [Aliifodinibius sp.]|nr:hypothetical protein [Fodinibius sp.]
MWLIYLPVQLTLVPPLHGQNIDLDAFIDNSIIEDITNLNESINSGLNSSVIQRIHSSNPLQINFAINKAFVSVPSEQRTGPLAKTTGFHIPFAQIEIGLPWRINLIGRGMSFEMGEQVKETAILWGIGFRYSMLDEIPDAKAGVVAVYEELDLIDDFDLQTFLIQAYLGYTLSNFNLYIASGITRSSLDIHILEPDTDQYLYRDFNISTLLKLVTGAQYQITRRLALTGNIVFGEYRSIGIGANVTLF